MSRFADELIQSMQEAIDFVSGKADKSKYMVYCPQQDQTKEETGDDKLYSIEEVFGEITPGDCMRGLRAKEDLTQKQLAEKLGVRPHHISEMEHNRRPISVQMAKKIQSVFGIGYKVFL